MPSRADVIQQVEEQEEGQDYPIAQAQSQKSDLRLKELTKELMDVPASGEIELGPTGTDSPRQAHYGYY